MHIRCFGLDGVCGMLPVTTGKEICGSAMAVEEAAAKVFAQGMQASGVLSSDKVPTPAQREQLRSSLGSFMGTKSPGKIMVAEAGLKYQGITIDPEASQMLESRSFSIEEMCRWSGGRNEVRRLENLPPIPGGDIYTVQSALVSLDQLGKQSAGMSPAATAFMLRIAAANQRGDKATLTDAFECWTPPVARRITTRLP